MSTTNAADSPASHEPRRVVAYDQFVDEQLSKVRSSIKVRDVAGGLILLLAGMLVICLVLVAADHWFFDLGFWGRLGGLFILTGWLFYVVVRRVVPWLFRSVNPAFAARVVEQREPSLKNSVLNFILFRADRQRLKEVVYRAVEQQAATNMARVEVETVVDQAPLVRLVAALAALLTLLAVYAALSPKNPFQTMVRVLAPWTDLPRPARVRIRDIQPGDSRVYFGETVDVSARVEGNGDEPVWLVYSTRDAQHVDRRVPMRRDRTRFLAQLPEEPEGISQDMVYRIEAGDAVTADYQLGVLPAPSIVVREVQCDYPAYTQLSRNTFEGEGDIVALEGTRVTIRGVANEKMSSAYIEFDSATRDAPKAQKIPPPRRKTIPMKVEDREASGSFTLVLRPEKQTPVHDRYQLRFVNQRGVTNDRPVEHRIQVTPDLPPLLEVLQPTRPETSVPEDGSCLIQVRAVDPDFQLTSVQVTGVARGKEVFTDELLDDPAAGQVVRDFQFRPQRLGLKAGDVAVVWATAADNRCHPLTSDPEPNTVRTERFALHVTKPRNEQKEKNGAEQRDGESADQGEGQPQGNGRAGGAPGDNRDGQSETPRQESGDGDRTGAESPRGEEGERGHQPGEAPGGQADGQSSESAGDDGQPDSDTAPAEGTDAAGNQASRSTQDASKPDASGASTSSQGQGRSDPNRDSTDRTSGAPNDSSKSPQRQGDEPGGDAEDGDSRPQDRSPEDAPQKPLPNDGSQDGDAFERILDQMQQQDTSGDRDARAQAADEARDERDSNEQATRSDQVPSAKQESEEPTEQARSAPKQQQRDGQDRPTNDRPEPAGQPTAPQPDAASAPDDASESEEPRDAPAAGQQPASQQPGEHEASETDREPPEPTNEERRTADNSASERETSQRDNELIDPTPAKATPQTKEPSEPEDEGPASQDQPKEPEKPGSSGSSAGSQPGSQECEACRAGNCAEHGTHGPAGQRGGDQAEGAAQGQTPSGSTAGQSRPGETAESGSREPRGSEPGESSDKSTADSAAERDSSGERAPNTGSVAGAADSPAGVPSGGSGGQIPGGGGTPGIGASPPDEEIGQEVPEGDAANLEYARKATDLALQYLERQRDNPDQRLLDRLGWTAADLQRFIRRWQELRRAAQQSGTAGEEGKSELDDALESLGLQPERDRIRRGKWEGDELSAGDAGTRSRPPSEYLEQYKAFLKSRTNDLQSSGVGSEGGRRG